MKDMILITNNKDVYEKYKDDIEFIFSHDYSFMDVLLEARDRIHEGHELLSHPLSGSLKPNETPYKSLFLSKKTEGLNMDSLRIIEESIQTTRKFLSIGETPKWTERILEDFRTIDLSLVERLIENSI